MRTATQVKDSPVYYCYWSLLVLLCFFFSLSGYWEFTKNEITYPKTIRMGYPPYFIISLGIAKIMGAMVLLLPGQHRLKEWVFAGFTFDVVFAFISGISINSKADCVKALLAFCWVLITYYLYHKLYKTEHRQVAGF